MKKIYAYLLGLVSLCAAGNLSAETEALFNGHSLDGWVLENGAKFSAEDGLLKIDRGAGWLRSKKTFGDFVLVMEFRFLEKDANSGIFIRTGGTSKQDKDGWPDNGYQIQCRDTLEGTFLGAMIPYGAPPFEHVSSRQALEKAYHATGDWQTYEITCKGETIMVKLNGELITLAIGIKNLDGHVGIQGEHGLLEFRKIEVTPIN